MHGLQSGVGGLGGFGGLNPRKKSAGPPVAGYFAWYSAKDRNDLISDGDNVIDWRGDECPEMA